MRIAFISAEMDPLAKVGGLADVMGSLPMAIKDLGHDVAIFLPFYGSIKGRKTRAKNLKIRVKPLGLDLQGDVFYVKLNGVDIYLIACEELFGRDGVYGDEQGDYPDNYIRFSFFPRASLEAIKVLDFRPAVIHLNDWQTSLASVYQALYYHDEPNLRGAGTYLSIHNLAYQGLFDKDILERIDIPWRCYNPEELEFWGKVNYLKGGIVFSTLIGTVSPTYATEIQSEEFGCGLHGILSKRRADLHGILNGIDYRIWDPEKDKEIYAPYSGDDFKGKKENKKRLQRSLKLKVKGDAPLLSMIGRLDEQKGFDILAQSAPGIIQAGAQIALLGAGKSEFFDKFRALSDEFPNMISINEGFNPTLARRLYASSDIFLMPSRYEPCGLGQMIAMRYGTPPLGRRTGGLADTIVDFDDDPSRGNGFLFSEPSPEALHSTITRALELYKNKERWSQLMARCMAIDFSWDTSARKYVELYQKTLQMKSTGGSSN